MSWVYRAMGSLRWAEESRVGSKKRGEKKKRQSGTESWLDTEKSVQRYKQKGNNILMVGQLAGS